MKKRVLSIFVVSTTLLLALMMIFQTVLADTFTISKAVDPTEGGSFTISPGQETYDLGAVLTLTATASGGWEFAGWFDTTGQLNGQTTNPFSEYEVTQSATITAKFTEICYALTTNVSPIDSGEISVSSDRVSEACDPGSYPSGATITLQASPADGYQFSSWTGATPGADPKVATVVMTAPKAVTATFALRCQSLTRSHTPPLGGNDPTALPLNSPGCDPGLYKKGEVISLTAVPAAGWRVISWLGTSNDSSTSTANSLTMPGLPVNVAGYNVTVNYGQKPTLQFSTTPFSVDENAGTATITITRTGSTAEAVSVDFATGAPGDTAVAGEDYEATAGTLDFATDVTTATFDVTIIDNPYADGSPELTLTLSNPTNGAVLGTLSIAKLKINDDEGEPTVQFSAADYSVDEAAGKIRIVVNLSPPPLQNVVVDFRTEDGTATAGEDYTAVARTIRFRFSKSETSKSIDIPIIDDALNEQDETVQLILEDIDGAVLGDNATAELVIIDDDPTPTLQFSDSAYYIKKGTSSTAVLPVSLSAISGQSVQAAYSITLNEGGNPDTGALQYDQGTMTQDITVPLASASVGDIFTVQLSDPVNAALGDPSTALIYILNTDINDCHTLTFSHTGFGQAPAPASKINSLGCPEGQYVADEQINIIAQPDPGWFVSQWTGTVDDSKKSLENAVVMPDSAFTVRADYRVALFMPLSSSAELFFEGPDELEPNNLFAEANGPIRRDRTYFGGFPTAEDGDDRFYFNLSAAAEVTITLDSIAPGQDYNLYLYDVNWSKGQVGYSGRVSNLSELIKMNVEPGKYYIRVLRAVGNPTTDKYELRLAIN